MASVILKSPISNQRVPVPISTTEVSDLKTGMKPLKNLKSILVTGAGSPGFIPIVKALNYRVIGVDMDEGAVGKDFVDKFYKVPPAKDELFIPAIREICKNEKVSVILPKVTAETEKLALEKDLGGAIVSISDYKTVNLCNNKLAFYIKCSQSRIPIPPFLIGNKFISKPIRGSGSEGVETLSFNEPKILMEHIQGEEYSVDILANHGDPLVIVPRIRTKVKAGISVEGVVTQQEQVIFWAGEITKLLKLNGIVGLQFIMDRNGIPLVIECNPRMHGTLALTIEAGANLPDLAVKLALGEEFEPPQIKWGLKMKRYLREVYE